MNSRDRVMMACNHGEADRVPIDCGAMRSTGISAIAYGKLLGYFGYRNEKIKMFDFQQQLAYVTKPVRDRFHIDAIDAGQAFLIDDSEWREWTLNDGTECWVPKYMKLEKDNEGNVTLFTEDGFRVGSQPKDSLYCDQIYWPLRDYDSIPEKIDRKVVDHTLWSVPSSPFHLHLSENEKDYRVFINGVKNLYESTDYAIMLSVGNSFFESGQFVRGTENFLCDIMTDPKGTSRLMDMLFESYIANLEKILAGVKEYVQILQFGDDLGTQNGPWMNPQLIKEVFVPYYKKMWRYVHEHSKCKVFMHSCGSIAAVLPYLVDAGLDIINPVQTSAANMDPVLLKREFGKDLTFWGGGCDTQWLLGNGTPEEIKEDVKRRIDIFAKDGGFVFNQVHNILANVPPENIEALYDAAYEYGAY